MIWTLALKYWKQIAGVLAVCLIIFAIDQNGANRVQKRWDAETAIRAASVKLAQAQNEANNKAITEQHKKDIEYAKSQAGHAAVAAWLKSHGLLPTGLPVSGACIGQTQSASGVNATGSESRPGVSLEEFANHCAQDALTVGAWQDWARGEGLQTY